MNNSDTCIMERKKITLIEDFYSDTYKPIIMIQNKTIMKKLPQELIVLNYLQKYNSITSWQMITKEKITRLAGKVFTLRKGYKGIQYHIDSTLETKNGKTYSRYTLKGQEEAW